jgi:hypothetical protein
MKALRSLMLTAALAATGVPSASAQSPEALQAARNLITLTAGSVVFDLSSQMAAQVWPAVEASIRAASPRVDTATMAELRREYERVQVGFLSELMNEAPAIYARHFTLEELRELEAFYRTPTGIKMLRVMPQTTAEMFAILSQRTDELQDKVNQAFVEALRKRGYLR